MRRAAALASPVVACAAAWLAIVAAQPREPATAIYDLLLQNGTVIDPSTERRGRFDIAIAGDRIVRIGTGLAGHQARTIIDASAYYVTPGLIDVHAYVNAQAVSRQGSARADWRNVNPDHNALRHGVTTVVDGGSTGWRTIDAFKQLVVDRSQVRILAFLNIVADGMQDDETTARLAELDVDRTVDAARRHRETVVGIRSPHLKGAGAEGVERAVRAAAAVPASALIEPLDEPGAAYRDVLERARTGDLVTHVFAAGSPLLTASGGIEALALAARQRGVLFDLGHGSRGFAFRTAVPAVRRGFVPDLVSTAMDKTSLLLPRAEMMTTMSKLLNMGVPLEHIVERATLRPARAIQRPELGTLREGGVADIAVIELQHGQFGFLDAEQARLRGDRRLRAVLTIRRGQVVWDSDGLSRGDWSTAGPYTNYR